MLSQTLENILLQICNESIVSTIQILKKAVEKIMS